MGRRIEFWFTYGSTYTYLSVMRIEALAAAAGVDIAWRPFDRAAADRPHAGESITTRPGPFVHPVKREYMWRDLERRAAAHGLPYLKPTTYPVPWRSTGWVGLVGFEEGWGPAFTRRVFSMNFAEGRSMGVDENLRDAISAVGQDPDRVLAKASLPDRESELLAATEEARSKCIFGSPSFMVDGELFWGDDRLDEAIAWTAR